MLQHDLDLESTIATLRCSSETTRQWSRGAIIFQLVPMAEKILLDSNVAIDDHLQIRWECRRQNHCSSASSSVWLNFWDVLHSNYTSMSALRFNVGVFPCWTIGVMGEQLRWRDEGHLRSERGGRRDKERKNKPGASLEREGKKGKKKNKYWRGFIRVLSSCFGRRLVGSHIKLLMF